MKYRRFEELPVWQEAIELADRTFSLCEARCFSDNRDFRWQLCRAALSISNNIAEGYERYTRKELRAFLYIARGSAGEFRSMLHLLARNERYRELEEERTALLALVESISRQLKGWLKNIDSHERTEKSPMEG